MLQQTQAERVRDYFTQMIEAFPTIESLAQSDYETFFPYYQGLGYYSRARNMLAAARMVVEEFWGVFPRESAKLRKLPGVWPYTAEAIRAFWYDIPTLSFDTNLEKIFSRYYFGDKSKKLSADQKQELLEQMQEFVEVISTPLKSPLTPLNKGENWTKWNEGISQKNLTPPLSYQEREQNGISRDINNALMDFGSLISLNTVANIDWENYPLISSKFYKTRGNLEPVKAVKKSSFPTRDALVFGILHENHRKYFSAQSSLQIQLTPNPSLAKRGEETEFKSSLVPLSKGGNSASLETPPQSPSSEGEVPSLGQGEQESLQPFFIGKNSWNPRAMTQDFFRERYELEVSVRPPEVKSYLPDGTPYLLSYIQIQSGKHDFQEFENIKVRGFEEGIVENRNFDIWEEMSLF